MILHRVPDPCNNLTSQYSQLLFEPTTLAPCQGMHAAQYYFTTLIFALFQCLMATEPTGGHPRKEPPGETCSLQRNRLRAQLTSVACLLYRHKRKVAVMLHQKSPKVEYGRSPNQTQISLCGARAKHPYSILGHPSGKCSSPRYKCTDFL
jgi:hypothetical protein